jgi:preprotein translocase subunit Sss1
MRRDLSRAARFRRLQELVERPAAPRHLTDDQILAEIQRVAKMLGRTPFQSEFHRHVAFSITVVVNRFGTWTNAIKQAGLELAWQRRYTKKQIIQEIRRVAKKLRKTPTVDEFKNFISLPCVYRHFGTWHSALKEAGLEPLGPRRDITDEQILAEIRRVARKLNKTPTVGSFQSQATIDVKTVQNRYGTWNNALKKAGFTPTREYSTDEQILAEIRQVAKILGRTPTQEMFNQHASISAQAAGNHFGGSWNKALKRACLKPVMRKDVTDKDVLREIRHVAKKLGKTPTKREFRQHANICGSCVANHFGTWNGGLRKAGLS